MLQGAFPDDDISTLAHFVNYGMTEGRRGAQNFDVASYRNAYADLRQAFGNDLKSYYLHYMNCGKREGRRQPVSLHYRIRLQHIMEKIMQPYITMIIIFQNTVI